MESKRDWKVLHSEYLVERPWATLRKDICEMPNGTKVPEYYVLEYPNWVNVVGLTKEGLFVLIRQYRHGAGKDFLEIPGGVIDDGETALQAAKREMLEETGYRFKHFREICCLYPNPATSNNFTTTFLAIDGVKVATQQLDVQEDIEIQLVSEMELKELLDRNAFGQALHVSALYYGMKALPKRE